MEGPSLAVRRLSIASPADFRRAAQARLPRFLFDYADGGANEETTLRANMADLAGIALRQRVLRGADEVDTAIDLFGTRQPLPLALAPIGIGGMYRRRGEKQAARAAHVKGVPFGLSTVSLCGVDEVRRASDARLWFQLYVIRDRAFMRDLLLQAKEAGAEALLFTVDMPVPGIRYRDSRSGMSGPYASARRLVQAIGKPAWAWDVGLHGRPHALGHLRPVLGSASGMEDYMGWLASNFDPTIGWRDLEWIRGMWDGPLIIKGILDPDDADAAAAFGADGIVVSNHGGRQLDGVLSTARALPPIVDRVGDRLTVLADSGVRSGLDAVRMLALGAKGVLLGRLWLYALAAGGEAGVVQMLDMIEREIRVAMVLTGVSRIDEIDGSILVR